MGRKHAYATKAHLERLALGMQKTGILYFEATREFKKQFTSWRSGPLIGIKAGRHRSRRPSQHASSKHSIVKYPRSCSSYRQTPRHTV
jgi:hypothetical protein